VPTSGTTVYEAAGGAPTIRRLIDAFYGYVAENEVLRPLFPEDFTEIREKQYEFLTQFFAGPALYTKNRGAPMLRARHMPFAISQAHADAWLGCMKRALDDAEIHGAVYDFMLERLTLTARHMVNQPAETESNELKMKR